MCGGFIILDVGPVMVVVELNDRPLGLSFERTCDIVRHLEILGFCSPSDLLSRSAYASCFCCFIGSIPQYACRKIVFIP